MNAQEFRDLLVKWVDEREKDGEHYDIRSKDCGPFNPYYFVLWSGDKVRVCIWDINGIPGLQFPHSKSEISRQWAAFSELASIYSVFFEANPELDARKILVTDLTMAQPTTPKCQWDRRRELLADLNKQDILLSIPDKVDAATNAVRRNMREWPVCKHGGEVTLYWVGDLAYWSCSVCTSGGQPSFPIYNGW